MVFYLQSQREKDALRRYWQTDDMGLRIQPGASLIWVSNGDTNGLLYYIGTNYGAESWANPQTRGVLLFVGGGSYTGSSPSGFLSDRATTEDGNLSLDSIYLDVGAGNKIAITDYTLQSINYNVGGNTWAQRSWTLQGSNNVSGTDETAFNAATWTTLDTRSGDATMGFGASQWGRYTIASAVIEYRFFRFINPGASRSDGGGAAVFKIAEIELYGNFIR